MRNHTKIYFDFFDIAHNESGWHDFIHCEICGKEAKDIHHIERRGMGGSKKQDRIMNLMALCREDHIKYGDKQQYKDFLKELHGIKVQEQLKLRKARYSLFKRP
jgi:hypothetical protein